MSDVGGMLGKLRRSLASSSGAATPGSGLPQLNLAHRQEGPLVHRQSAILQLLQPVCAIGHIACTSANNEVLPAMPLPATDAHDLHHNTSTRMQLLLLLLCDVQPAG